jgi:hypothetical protein
VLVVDGASTVVEDDVRSPQRFCMGEAKGNKPRAKD